ncbi:PAS domain-containing protein [Gilvimarinus polysaccharolyticus]|uniref:PAS domain-containing protein n=1 Tax=Gilvimarinus polysaccharolyticus TaxID=863921 RepID=UPI00067332E8|nr:PAS domain-containing protein [Gilvimarinus polysaccharolyticus]
MIELFLFGLSPLTHDLEWQPTINLVQVMSDVLIALVFFVIAAGLLAFRRKRQDLEYPRLVTLFSVFLLLCGLDHAFRIYTLLGGSPNGQAVLSALTAIVAVITALGLLWIIPKVFGGPSAEQLQQAMAEANNEKLERLALKARYDAEYSLREAANASPMGLIVVGEHGQIKMANTASCHLFGYANSELLQRDIASLLDLAAVDENQHPLTEFFSSNVSSGQHLECVVQGIRSDGSYVPVELKLVKRDHLDDMKTFVSVVDISERLAQQQQVEAISNRLERITSASREGLWEWEIESGLLWWSPALWQLLGYQHKPTDVTMYLWEAHIVPEHQAKFFNELDRNLIDGGSFDIEFLGVTVNRESRWFRVRGNCVGGSSDHKRLMCGTLEDIQQRKDLELKLSEKNQLLESIYTGTRYGVFVLDCLSNGQIVYKAVNPAITKALGIQAEQLLDQSTQALAPEIMPHVMAEQIDSRYRRCRQTGKPITYIESFPLRGQPVWWQTSLYPLMDDAGDIYRIIGSSADVTDLKTTENKLAKSEQFLQNVVDLAICGLYIYDLPTESNIFVNQQYTRLTGYTKDDLNNVDDLSVLFHPDEIDDIAKQVDKAMTLDSATFLEIEYRFWHKDGYWIWCYAFDSVYARDERGRPTQLLGTFIDVSQLKHYSERLRKIDETTPDSLATSME